MPDNSLLKKIAQQRCISGAQLSLFAKLGWEQCCDRKKETTITFKLNEAGKQKFSISLVFNWEHGDLFLIVSKSSFTTPQHNINIDGSPLDELLEAYIDNLPVVTFKSFNENNFLKDIDKNSLYWKEISARLSLLTEALYN